MHVYLYVYMDMHVCTMYAGSSGGARALSATDFSRWLAQSPSKRSQLTRISMTSIPSTQ